MGTLSDCVINFGQSLAVYDRRSILFFPHTIQIDVFNLVRALSSFNLTPENT